jgi:hypothetical protein
MDQTATGVTYEVARFPKHNMPVVRCAAGFMPGQANEWPRLGSAVRVRARETGEEVSGTVEGHEVSHTRIRNLEAPDWSTQTKMLVHVRLSIQREDQQTCRSCGHRLGRPHARDCELTFLPGAPRLVIREQTRRLSA